MDEIKNEMVIPFTMVPNEVLKNSELSLKHKGMMCYLLSLPKDWVIYKAELQNHFTDGRDSISGTIEDLVEFGYISKQEKPKEQGKFSGYIYTIKPLLENRNGLSVTENPLLIKTNIIITNKEIDSKLSNAELPSSTTATVLSDSEKCRLFIKRFNEIKNSKYKSNSQICGKLKQRVKEKYEAKDIFKALRLAIVDPFHVKEKLKYVTPEYILRSNILEKYLNIASEEEKSEVMELNY